MREPLRITSYRSRWLFVLCLITLGVSAGVAGTVVVARWRADRTAAGTSELILHHAAGQLGQRLQRRRDLLTLLRETLDHAPTLDREGRSALARNLAAHAPDLLAIGVLRQGGAAEWWVLSPEVTAEESAAWPRQVAQRTWWRTVLNLPSVLLVAVDPQRPRLVLTEPRRAPARRADLLVAVADLPTLAAGLPTGPPAPALTVQVREGGRLIYQAGRIVPAEGAAPPVDIRTVSFGGTRWIVTMPHRLAPLVPRAWLNTLMVIVAGLIVSSALGTVWSAERLRQMATTDELTGLWNRRCFLERWPVEVERARRYGRPLSCLMMDIVGFKRINDRFGHAAGDQVLRRVAEALQARLRLSDLPARFGGDEFIVALPETDRAAADAVAAKLRDIAIGGPWGFSRDLGPVSLSVGVGHCQAGDGPLDPIRRADEDLYAGRPSHV